MADVTLIQLSKEELQELIRSVFEEEIKKLKSQTPYQEDQSLTTAQAAGFMKISLPTLYKLIEHEIIPSFHIGRTIRISKNALIQAMNEKRYKKYNSLKN